MKKTEHADRETRDIRHGVATGKGFFNSLMSKLHGNSNPANLFDQLGEQVPEGLPGTNPNDMAREELLEEVHRYF